METLAIETIHEIITYLDNSRDVANFCACNSALYRVGSDPRIWARLYGSEWVLSNDSVLRLSHGERKGDSLPSEDAKQSFRNRKMRDRAMQKCILSLVENPRGRLKYVEAISDNFLDGIDAIIEFRIANGKAKKNLGIDYYCTLVEQHMSRKLGIHMLSLMSQDPSHFPSSDFGPIAALSALNCFQGSQGLMLNTLSEVEAISREVVPNLYSHAEWDALPLSSTRDSRREESKTNAICHAMTIAGIVGATPEIYYDIRNTFISNALLMKRPTIPLTVVAVFVAVCGRLGIEAYAIPFPGEMLAAVKDGEELIYITPNRGRTFTRQELEQKIYTFGLQYPDSYLRPCDTKTLCERAARNLLVCIERGSEKYRFEALYCAAVTLKLLRQQMPLAEDQFMSLIGVQFPYDILIWEKFGTSEHRDTIQRIRLEDVTKRKPKLRSKQSVELRHRVGTIFRHATFHYTAIIVGWDSYCDQSPQWIQQMRVNSLERQAAQPFYNVLAADGSERYVAEDNILPITANETPAVSSLVSLDLIGKYFKSYNSDGFILSSDLHEMYPEDVIKE